MKESVHELSKTMSNQESVRRSVLEKKTNSIRDTIKYLERSGLPLSKAEEQLSVIHVAGTKGKVSFTSN